MRQIELHVAKAGPQLEMARHCTRQFALLPRERRPNVGGLVVSERGKIRDDGVELALGLCCIDRLEPGIELGFGDLIVGEVPGQDVDHPVTRGGWKIRKIGHA